MSNIYLLWNSFTVTFEDLNLDGDAFIDGVRQKLIPIAPIIEHAINKQLMEVGTTPEMMNPKEAQEFIDKMYNALLLFLGNENANKARTAMMIEFRKTAPDFFEEKSLI